jgi:hypothetical protein
MRVFILERQHGALVQEGKKTEGRKDIDMSVKEGRKEGRMDGWKELGIPVNIPVPTIQSV